MLFKIESFFIGRDRGSPRKYLAVVNSFPRKGSEYLLNFVYPNTLAERHDKPLYYNRQHDVAQSKNVE